MLFNWLLEHRDHNVTSSNWNTNILEKFTPLPDYLGGIIVRGFKVVKSEHVKSDDLSRVKTCLRVPMPQTMPRSPYGGCSEPHGLQMGFLNCTMFAFSGMIYKLTSTS